MRNFFRNEGLIAFLADPRSPDIPAGVNYKEFIDEKLLSSHLMVPICNSGIHKSKPALREIHLAVNAPKPIPIVAFTRKGCRLPKLIKDKWEPIRFDPTNPKSAHSRLLIGIYRRIDYEREKFEDIHITRPTEFPIFKGLKKLLRRR